MLYVSAKIFHHAFGDDGSQVGEIDFPATLISPAEADVAAEFAYLFTQNSANSWWENPGLKLVGSAAERGGCRSTSVGDRIVVVDETGNETTLWVDMIGFSDEQKED